MVLLVSVPWKPRPERSAPDCETEAPIGGGAGVLWEIAEEGRTEAYGIQSGNPDMAGFVSDGPLGLKASESGLSQCTAVTSYFHEILLA